MVKERQLHRPSIDVRNEQKGKAKGSRNELQAVVVDSARGTKWKTNERHDDGIRAVTESRMVARQR